MILFFSLNVNTLCIHNSQSLKDLRSKFLNNSNSKLFEYKWDRTNSCNSTDTLNAPFTINDFIAMTLTALGSKSKRLLVLYESTATISENDIQNSEFYTHIPELHVYSVTGCTNCALRYIFTQENVYSEVHYLCIGSFTFLKSVLQLVNTIDYIFNQQAYFSHIHKWIMIDQEHVACSNKLLYYIDKIDNVACIKAQNEFLEHNAFQVYTAMFGITSRYWQPAHCANVHHKTLCSKEDIFPNVQFKMNNRHVTIGTNIMQGYVDIDSNDQYSGMFIEILQDLARNLNFTYNIVLPKDTRWGNLLANGSWNGLIGEIDRREIDFIVGPLARNQYREQVMDYVDYDLFKYHIAGVYKLPSRRITSFNLYLKPFDLSVHITLLVTIIVAGLLFTFKKVCKNANQIDVCNYIRFIYMEYYFDYIYYITMSLLGQPNALKNVVRYRRKDYNFGIINMCGIVLVTLWSAKLVSYLTVNIQAVPIKTFDDLLNQNTYKFGMNGATNVVNQFSQSTDYRDKQLWARLQELARNDPEVLSKSDLKLTEKLQKEKFVLIGPIDFLRHLANQNCDYVITQDEYRRNGVTLGLQNNSAYKSYFNDFTLRLTESGIVDRMRKYIYPVTQCNKRVQTHHTSIMFEVVIPVFYGLFCMTFVAFIILLFENSISKCKQIVYTV